MNMERVEEIIDHYESERTASLAVLQDIQREYNYLPREVLELVAERLEVPLGEIYGMATFFKAFSLQPKGEYICKVCLGTACHVRGGPRILEALERELNIRVGNTTADGRFSLEAVRCVGACALGPILLVNEEPHALMTPDKAAGLIAGLATGEAERGAAPPPALPTRATVDLSAVPPPG
jgi:NADH:ubiquinone oxidoreductase subunit E